MPRLLWTRQQQLAAFNLYCHTPFGRLHQTNPEVLELAQKLGRTPSAVVMKCVNFASLDPDHQKRGVKGLTNVSEPDRALWIDFRSDSQSTALESQQAWQEVMKRPPSTGELPPSYDQELQAPLVTETAATRRIRLVQSFFRAAVITSYELKCAICGFNLPDMLNASHVIPWSHNVKRRADPTNGLALCALHDRAFDRGYLTFDDELNAVVSARAKKPSSSRLQEIALLEVEGQPLTLPHRFRPDPAALAYHRDHVFR